MNKSMKDQEKNFMQNKRFSVRKSITYTTTNI